VYVGGVFVEKVAEIGGVGAVVGEGEEHYGARVFNPADGFYLGRRERGCQLDYSSENNQDIGV
jgi:hypothetical protein